MAEESSFSSTKTISLTTADNTVHEVESTLVDQMQMVYKNLPPPHFLPNISTHALNLIIDYSQNTKDFESMSDEDLRILLNAAHYLKMPNLYKTLINATARRLENETEEYNLKFFGRKKDLTPEEEADLRKKNAWAFGYA